MYGHPSSSNRTESGLHWNAVQSVPPACSWIRTPDFAIVPDLQASPGSSLEHGIRMRQGSVCRWTWAFGRNCECTACSRPPAGVLPECIIASRCWKNATRRLRGATGAVAAGHPMWRLHVALPPTVVPLRLHPGPVCSISKHLSQFAGVFLRAVPASGQAWQRSSRNFLSEQSAP
jgi:hypothetical protein